MKEGALFAKHGQQMAHSMMRDLVACFMLPVGQGA
jgi:hypothetical protein